MSHEHSAQDDNEPARKKQRTKEKDDTKSSWNTKSEVKEENGWASNSWKNDWNNSNSWNENKDEKAEHNDWKNTSSWSQYKDEKSAGNDWQNASTWKKDKEEKTAGNNWEKESSWSKDKDEKSGDNDWENGWNKNKGEKSEGNGWKNTSSWRKDKDEKSTGNDWEHASSWEKDKEEKPAGNDWEKESSWSKDKDEKSAGNEWNNKKNDAAGGWGSAKKNTNDWWTAKDEATASSSSTHDWAAKEEKKEGDSQDTTSNWWETNKHNDGNSWSNDNYKKPSTKSEAMDNYWLFAHGSKEWKDAIADGKPGLSYQPGDEKLGRVLPKDFLHFTEEDCSQWKNKPLVLLSTSSFWVFGKSVNWVCSNASPKQLREFQPGALGGSRRNWDSEGDNRVMRCEGSLPAYVVCKFGKDFPFVCENTEMYDVAQLREHGLVKSGYGMLHRLDRETSGPVLIAKTKESFKRLVAERDNHNWHKEYITLVHGKFPAEQYKGVIDIPLRRKKVGSSSFTVDGCHRCWKRPHYTSSGHRVKCVGEDSEGYRCFGEAKSYYEVVKYYQYTRQDGKTMDYTFVRIKLVSGKTHQIRVHMRLFCKELGFPVYGVCSDFKYLKDNFPTEYQFDCRELSNRVFLHSVVLGFRDPDDPFTNRVAMFQLQNDLMSTIRKMTDNTEAFQEIIRYQGEVKRTKIGKFAVDFGINSDAQKAVEKCEQKNDLIDAFYKRCEHPTDQPAARSFNGDHSAMVLRVLQDLEREMDTLDELVDREFPEKMKREDDAKLPLPRGWVKKESRSCPGAFYYFNQQLNKVQIEHPARAEMDGLPPGWKKVESKSRPGKFYYYDSNTSTSHLELPEEVRNYKPESSNSNAAPSPPTGTSVIPAAKNEWLLRESTKNKGAFYWWNPALSRASIYHPLGLETLPQGWVRKESSNIKGKYYFVNSATGQTAMEHPTSKKTWCDAPEPWLFQVSKTDKSKCYWINKTSKETTMNHPVTGTHVVNG